MSNDRPHIILKETAEPTTRTFQGGGGGTYPRNSYKRHAAEIFRQANELAQYMATALEKTNAPDRLYFRVALPPNISAWTTQGKSIVETLHSEVVASPAKNVTHVSTRSRSFKLALEEIDRYRSTPKQIGKSKFAPIESIGAIPLSEKISSHLAPLLDDKAFSGDALIALFPDLNRTERETVKAAVAALLEQSSGNMLDELLTDSGLYLRVRAPAAALKQAARYILAIQSVDRVDEVVEPSSRVGAPFTDSIVVDPNASKAIACIFDTGVVSGSRFLQASLLTEEQPLGPPSDVDHGTFVASRVIFGDGLRDQVSAGRMRPDVKVLSICHTSEDSSGNQIRPKTDQLMRIVRDTVERWHRRIRVYNLSLNLVPQVPVPVGTIAHVTDDTVGPLAAELDQLARKHDVLFVLTTGNYPLPNEPSPNKPFPSYFSDPGCRILPPAEAMLALTVGSIAGRENSGSMARSGDPSPFTRRGPGFSEYRKPDLVTHGGNVGKMWQSVDDLATAGICDTGDAIAYGEGTSYAAPLITRLAAQVFAVIPKASASLVRALLVHVAWPRPQSVTDSEDILRILGNGVPDPDRVLTSSRWQQTFYFDGHINYRQIVRIPFFVPTSLIRRKGRKKVRVRYTLAFAPETNRTLKSGYCKSHMRSKLVKLDTSGVLKEVADDKTADRLSQRYSTIVRGGKTFSSHVSGGDWQLLVEQESRWTLKETKTSVAVVVTVEDPRNDANVDIHAAIRAEAGNRYRSELRAPIRTKA